MKAGAHSFVEKPIDVDYFLLVVQKGAFRRVRPLDVAHFVQASRLLQPRAQRLPSRFVRCPLDHEHHRHPLLPRRKSRRRQLIEDAGQIEPAIEDAIARSGLLIARPG